MTNASPDAQRGSDEVVDAARARADAETDAAVGLGQLRVDGQSWPPFSDAGGVGSASASADVTIEATLTEGDVPDFERIIRGLRPAARRCYRRELERERPAVKTAPPAIETLVANAVIRNGEVESTRIVSSFEASRARDACILSRLRNTTFSGNGVGMLTFTFLPRAN